jgi:hypothetical protein
MSPTLAADVAAEAQAGEQSGFPMLSAECAMQNAGLDAAGVRYHARGCRPEGR